MRRFAAVRRTVIWILSRVPASCFRVTACLAVDAETAVLQPHCSPAKTRSPTWKRNSKGWAKWSINTAGRRATCRRSKPHCRLGCRRIKMSCASRRWPSRRARASSRRWRIHSACWRKRSRRSRLSWKASPGRSRRVAVNAINSRPNWFRSRKKSAPPARASTRSAPWWRVCAASATRPTPN